MLRFKKRVFFDYAAGTPLDTHVLKKMTPYIKNYFYNPSSLYTEAVQVSKDMQQARATVADVFSVRTQEIVFVDGATEANNLAIMGTFFAWKKKYPQQIPHIITTEIEHPSVLEVCKYLETQGAEVSYIAVDTCGVVDSSQLKKELKETTIIVSIGYVNGEIGVTQDIKALTKIVRLFKKNNKSEYPYFHTDAVQAIPYEKNISPRSLGVDMLTANGSKIYGPKKIGCLFVRTGVDIHPLLHGGNQEQGLRPGTENIPSCIGFAEALVRVRSRRDQEHKRLESLYQKCIDTIITTYPKVIVNSCAKERSPHIINVSFPGLHHEELLLRLDAEGVLCSAKSACKSGEEGNSHVIIALRKQTQDSSESLRFSLGYGTRIADILYLKKALTRSLSYMNIHELH